MLIIIDIHTYIMIMIWWAKVTYIWKYKCLRKCKLIRLAVIFWLCEPIKLYNKYINTLKK